MKINNLIRAVYFDREPLYRRLADDVKDRLKAAVEAKNWFFAYRVKSLESFAIKIETGRIPNPATLEDFFACTIVVPTMSEIKSAIAVVNEQYDVCYRRPKADEKTHKRSHSFEFDDLRLYVRRRPTMSGASADLDELVFEVQVKTVLQYAWSVATHDLIYKTDSVNWNKERIAFQVKAMLEHAELAIAEAAVLSKAEEFICGDEATESVSKVIGILTAVWSAEFLPSDLKRTAENITFLLKVADLSPEQLLPVLEVEKARYGILPTNLSPYAFVVQAVANDERLDLNNKLRKRRLNILIHPDMDLPAWCNGHPRCVVVEKNRLHVDIGPQNSPNEDA